jgi:hypothetical protein
MQDDDSPSAKRRRDTEALEKQLMKRLDDPALGKLIPLMKKIANGRENSFKLQEVTVLTTFFQLFSSQYF